MKRSNADVLDPKDKATRRIFTHSNWAHHLSPVNYAPNENQPKGWLPVVRYRNDEELYRVLEAPRQGAEAPRVVPRRALDKGYTFRYLELEPALRDLLGR